MSKAEDQSMYCERNQCYANYKDNSFAVPSATTSLKQDDDEKETPRETVSKGPEDITLGPILPKQDLRSSQEIQGDAEEQAEKPSTTTNKIDSSDHFKV